MKTLHLFDIDGTLTRSGSVDQRCYIDAFKTVFDIDITQYPWCSYPLVTDWVLAEHIWQLRYQKSFPEELLAPLNKAFMLELQKRYTENPDHIVEIPGALTYFNRLAAQGVPVAFATGCWRESAQFKLAKIGLDLGDHVIGHSGLHYARPDIMKQAICQAQNVYDFEHVIYYGDGIWDLKACKELNIPLIGIDGDQKGTLHAAGHDRVYHDYFKLDHKDLAAMSKHTV